MTTDPSAMISFDHVTKSYGGTPAVDDLSLDIGRGKITVFVGPSGCGKTTSLRMINRMVDPTSGTITVDGRNVADVPAAQLRRTMGYVLQSAGLMPHRTVLDNVMTVPRLNGVDRSSARKRGMELLETVGLDTSMAKRYPAQLSGGQQQRVGVARALAADPPILLMDEPFSAVDPVVRDELQAELLRLQRELAKTIVFVTHDIDEATILGDMVAVFAVGGHLAQYATPEEILRAPADDFVASFVGRDRGFRHLSFTDARGLTIHPVEPTVLAHAGAETTLGWRLVVDESRRPAGWIGPNQRPAGESFTRDELVPGGSLYHQGGSLRTALDAALSAPSGLGVVIDDDGAVTGVLKPSEVLEAIEADRAGLQERIASGNRAGQRDSGAEQAQNRSAG